MSSIKLLYEALFCVFVFVRPLNATEDNNTIAVDSELTSADSLSRPFYIIGHMANSVATLDSFLAQGANGIEVDVTFESNGAAWYLFHGVPCDYFRVCHESSLVVEYFRAAARRDFALFFLDLKGSRLSDSSKEFAGVDLARKLHGHFWSKGGEKINVVLSVPALSDMPIIRSFVAEIRLINETLMEKLSFDVSENPPFHLVSKEFLDLNITNVWQGDGITNWFEPFRGYGRVESAIGLRDGGNHVIKKVYRWTVDYTARMRDLILLGLDGIMTNHPYRTKQVLQDMREIRLARSNDNVNEFFTI